MYTHEASLVVFTKPPLPGRVKTRLIGDLTAEQAAELHGCFVEDLLARLRLSEIPFSIAWALEDDEAVPDGDRGLRQSGDDLGARLYNGLAQVAEQFECVAAVGSDHPDLALERVVEAFERLRDSDVVFGPATDGGYYLVAVRRDSLRAELFEGIEWSSAQTLEQSLARCQDLGLSVYLLAAADDVDTPEDLNRLTERLRGTVDTFCPCTKGLLTRWGRF